LMQAHSPDSQAGEIPIPQQFNPKPPTGLI
jgi:hypothetical protein